MATRGASPRPRSGSGPRGAFQSFSNFGYQLSERTIKLADAVSVLDARIADLEYEGEMDVVIPLNIDAAAHYLFSRLTGPANMLVVPARDSASIPDQLLRKMAGETVIGVQQPIQICSTNSTVSDILNMAAIVAGGVAAAE
ncbi:hypothetical protein DWB67_12500 [Paracoccus sp. JM45]|nr:hypothetical protein DWB67_12500 [Paracoccus sp. JM45]